VSTAKIINSTQLTVAWLTMFILGTDLFVFSPLIPIVAADFGTSAAMTGLGVTVFSSTYMLTAPLLGHLSDRIGRRGVLIGSLLAFGVANLLIACAPDLHLLLVTRVFAGATAAGVSPSIYALVGNAAAPERRATCLSIVVSGLLLSLAIGASTGTFVGGLFGWRSVFVTLGVLSLTLAAINCRVWPRHLQAEVGFRVHPTFPIRWLLLVRRMLPTVVWSTSLYSVYTYLGTGLVSLGFSNSEIASAISLYGCGAIVGVLAGGRLTDRFGSKFTTGASLAGLCACFLLLRLTLETGAHVELVLALTSAIAQLFFPAQQAGLVRDFPSQRSTVLACNNSALFLGISLGSLVGRVADGNLYLSLTISAGIALIGCIMNRVAISWVPSNRLANSRYHRSAANR
jgi:DHA1 family purine base/nucleoside efflux pump-like MFS transporter